MAMIRSKGEHATADGAKKIEERKVGMNTNRSWDDRYDYIAERIDQIEISPEWLRCFTDGEGHLG